MAFLVPELHTYIDLVPKLNNVSNWFSNFNICIILGPSVKDYVYLDIKSHLACHLATDMDFERKIIIPKTLKAPKIFC